MKPIIWLLTWLTLSFNVCWSQELIVGSDSTSESVLLAEILAQSVEANTDLTVTRKYDFKDSGEVLEALGRADIHLAPGGTLAAMELLGEKPTGDALKSWLRVEEAFGKKHSAKWLKPFGFEERLGLTLTQGLAETLDVHTISDLRGRTETLLGASKSASPQAELNKAYGLNLSFEIRPEAESFEQLVDHGFNLTFVSTSDAKLHGADWRVLIDDQEFFPVNVIAPIIHEDIWLKYPELKTALRSLEFSIDDLLLRRLKAKVEIEGESTERVVEEFLAELSITPQPKAEAKKIGVFGYLFRAETLVFIRQHLILTVVATLAAAILGIPLGIYITKNKNVAKVCLGLASIVQTIPSLALLALLIPIAGLGGGADFGALVLYALIPIMRNTYTGLKAVDRQLLDSANALGLTELESLRRVQLPLAATDILGGVRISAVISVRVATVAAFIGAGGLGEPILVGLQSSNAPMVLSGAIPAALLSIFVDAGLGRLEKAFEPHFKKEAKA